MKSLAVYNFAVGGCEGCCGASTFAVHNKIHAHLDGALQILYLVTNRRLYSIVLDESVEHKQQEGYKMALLSEGVALPDFFQVATREIIQISSATQIPYRVHLPRETPDGLRPSQMFYIMTENGQNESHFGVLDVRYRYTRLSMNVQGAIELDFMTNATSDPLRLKYTNIFASDQILRDLEIQIQNRHFRGVDSSVGGAFFDMRLLGFSILNQQVCPKSQIVCQENFSWIPHSTFCWNQNTACVMVPAESEILRPCPMYDFSNFHVSSY